MVEASPRGAQPLHLDVERAPALGEGIRLPLADEAPQVDLAAIGEAEPRVAALHADQSTPDCKFRRYRVYIDLDRFDPDEGRVWVTVPRALGYFDMKRQVELDYPAAVVLRYEEVAG